MSSRSSDAASDTSAVTDADATAVASDSAPRLVVVGIGADGWDGLSPRAQASLRGAAVIYGSRRQLELLPTLSARIEPWRSPMSGHLAEVLCAPEPRIIHILASGDPMFHGVGSTVIRAVGAARVEVISAPSSVSLACARLGWDLATTRIVSAVTADPEVVIPELTDGHRVLVLSRDATTPARIVEILRQQGYQQSTVTVLEQLGGPAERISTYAGTAPITDTPGGEAVSAGPVLANVDPLNLVAIEVSGSVRSSVPGRDEAQFTSDGQITKSAVRALTVCALAPTAGQTLWDVGSGSGSVAIEWLRAEPATRAVSFEVRTDRAALIATNAHAHGVADRIDIRGAAPLAFADAAAPDTIFIGGGLTAELLTTAWEALTPGGRLVANTVTIENQNLIIDWDRIHPGTLRRLSIENAAPLGGFTVWRPALPVVQWIGEKPLTDDPSDHTPQPKESA